MGVVGRGGRRERGGGGGGSMREIVQITIEMPDQMTNHK